METIGLVDPARSGQAASCDARRIDSPVTPDVPDNFDETRKFSDVYSGHLMTNATGHVRSWIAAQIAPVGIGSDYRSCRRATPGSANSLNPNSSRGEAGVTHRVFILRVIGGTKPVYGTEDALQKIIIVVRIG
jgi:hypothetical protein